MKPEYFNFVLKPDGNIILSGNNISFSIGEVVTFFNGEQLIHVIIKKCFTVINNEMVVKNYFVERYEEK